MEPRPLERWCLDRRTAGERKLTPEERVALAKQRRRVAWWFGLPGLALIAYWAVIILTIPAPSASDAIRGVHLFCMALGLLLLLPIAILQSLDAWRELRDLGRDLLEDRIECFEPVVTGTATDMEGIVEVRHPSGRMLTGPVDAIGDPAPVREVAPGPIIGLRVRHPAEGLPEGARLERRHLSPEERDEIQRAIRQVKRIPKAHLVPALWFVVCVWVWVQGGSTLTSGSKLLLLQGVIMAGWVVWHAVRNHVLARRMSADVEDGFALVFVPPDPQASAEEEGLPHSGLPWRIAGLPAEWRGEKLFSADSR